MTDVIQLLPDSVANQIAAGEVIQRPASVIKELVENAVDAGATTINVLVVDAGRTSIQVIDDGCGMSETDARLAFERHATSKISKADDLFSLHTMGFRGEALPSIAAVSQVELRTRRQEDEIGTCLLLSGSHVESQEACSCAVGCSFTVSNLFFNVPARRKFLKTNATELNNILSAFERIVLVYPSIHFTMHSNGQELMNLRPGSLRQRITDVYGRRYGQDLLPVSVDTTMCNISGFVAKPEAARKKGAPECFFVNERYMRHPYFHKAVLQAYERLVPTGVHIPYFIYFDVNPADIDVNIHPTKTEIKFENEQYIWQLLLAAVRDAIGQFCDIPQINFDTEGKPEIPPYIPQGIGKLPVSNSIGTSTGKGIGGGEGNGMGNGVGKSSTNAPSDWQQLFEGLNSQRPTVVETPLFPTDDNVMAAVEPSPSHYQYKGQFILTSVKSGLMIVDQHRADVRIRFEQYMAQLEVRTAEMQQILFPEVIQFTKAEQVIVEEMLPKLASMGFDLTDLGQGSYAINGVPTGIDGLNYPQLLHDMVDEAQQSVETTSEEINRSLALSMARHVAIPYGQVLSNNEMENLINELFACSNVNYTPDGKAILAIMPHKEIEHLLN